VKFLTPWNLSLLNFTLKAGIFWILWDSVGKYTIRNFLQVGVAQVNSGIHENVENAQRPEIYPRQFFD
jgi:hypothetical protein